MSCKANENPNRTAIEISQLSRGRLGRQTIGQPPKSVLWEVRQSANHPNLSCGRLDNQPMTQIVLWEGRQSANDQNLSCGRSDRQSANDQNLSCGRLDRQSANDPDLYCGRLDNQLTTKMCPVGGQTDGQSANDHNQPAGWVLGRKVSVLAATGSSGHNGRAIIERT